MWTRRHILDLDMIKDCSTQELVLVGESDDLDQANLLILVGQSHRLLAPSPRVIRLDPLDQLDLGRGNAPELTRVGERAAEFKVDDPWLSVLHASILQRRGSGGSSFHLEDRRSTNGCRLNGRPVTSSPLTHGDIIETGGTFWMFRSSAMQRLPLLLERAYPSGPVLPTSSVSLEFLDQVTRLMEFAATDIPLIILGESGTGKEVMTGEVHHLSGRTGRMLALNCAALPSGLIESEIFGHRRGAFTGATVDKRGIVEVAEGGTLLLDEVGDMPLAAQAKMLRLLQDGTFMRVGETMGRRVNVRFIAATHRDLNRMVREGTFRGDLFARLNGFSVRIPPLRHRKEDMGLLLSVLLGRRWSGDGSPRMEPRVFRALMQYDWPHNVRELENAVRTALALSRPDGEITLDCLPDAVRLPAGPEADVAAPRAAPAGVEPSKRGPGRPRLGDQELRDALPRLMKQHQGNLAKVASELNTSRSQLYRLLKRAGIDPKVYRK